MDHGALSLSWPPNVRALMTGPVIHISREIQPCVDLGWEESPRPRFSRMADGGWRMADGAGSGSRSRGCVPAAKQAGDASFGAWSFTS